MSTYREIVGKKIKKVSSDPSDGLDGQMWYNSTTGTLRGIAGIEAWSTTSPGIYSKNTAGGAGTTTAAVVYGGASSSGTVYHNETVEYDGSGFSVSGNLNTSRQDGGSCGTQTAALFVGGEAPPGNVADTEEYNGSTWSEETNIPTSDRGWGSLGLQTAAVMVGGATAPTTKCFEYDGSSWTTGGALTDGRRLSGMGCGTETAGLVAGGDPNSNKTETYNGTGWTAGNVLNTGRQQGKMSGPQTAGLVWGGETPSLTTATEKFDGTSWTTSPGTLGTAVKNNAGNKDTTSGASALNVYGNIPADTSSAEEYNEGALVITPGAWASAPSLNTARYGLGGFGTATAGVAFAGRDSPIYQATEEYDGNTWTTVNNYPQTINDPGSTGILTAGLGLGGLNPPSIPSFPTTGRVTGEYDGTNWTTGGSYTYDAWGAECAGTQTATLAGGGHNYPMPPGNISSSAEYNGTGWTAGESMSQARALFASSGSQTAALFTGGRSSPGVEDPTNKTEEYNGASFSNGGDYITNIKENTQGGGPQTAAYMAGGSIPPYTSNTGHYDGTTWATASSLPAVKGMGNAASNTADNTTGLVFGGVSPSTTGATYTFTAETTAVNVKTLTQS